MESNPSQAPTLKQYIYFFSKNVFMQVCTANDRAFLVAIAKDPLKEVML